MANRDDARMQEAATQATLRTHGLAHKLEIAQALAETCTDAWFDNATSYSCTEAEAIADFLRAFESGDTADHFLGYHALDDDEGDSHEPVMDARGAVVGYKHRDEIEE